MGGTEGESGVSYSVRILAEPERLAGVVDLDGDAVGGDHDVSRLGRATTGHVLGERSDEYVVDGDLELGDGPSGREGDGSSSPSW